MALPKIETSVFPLTFPVSKKTVKFRPFTVKEQKILLESIKDDIEITTLQSVLNNCIVGDVDIADLPLTDIEFLFLKLRGKSVGEIIDMVYVCENEVEKEDGKKGKCGQQITASLDINKDIRVENENFSNSVKLDDDFVLEMSVPKMKDGEKLLKQELSPTDIFDIMISCIDVIHYKDNVYNTAEHGKDELVEFFDGLTAPQVNKIKDFFENLPKLKSEIELNCSSCGSKEKIPLEGLSAFLE